MTVELTDIEVRVLGSLVEKAVTTPEYYPLTLNALVNACNQKSNREPVVSYDAITVNEALENLKSVGLVRTMMGGDSRVPKYKHYFDEAFELTPQEVALLDVLMLRGPQTVGELRQRSERMYAFEELGDIEVVLEGLIERPDGPLVVKLPRQPGRKEHRYAHLLSGEPVFTEEEGAEASPMQSRSDRLQQLEEEVEELKQTLQQFMDDFAAFRRQFE